MTDYYANKYGQFEGLERLDELELSNEDYQFYLVGLWKGEEGFFLGTDSGCSCPTPWEDYERSDLTGPLTAEQAREEVESLIRDAREAAEESTWREGPDPEEAAALLLHLAG